MIKFISPLLFLVSFAPALHAQDQDSTKLSWSADIGATYSLISISQRVEMQFGVMATYKRHQFRAAPLVHLWSSEAANNPKKLSFSGLALNYFYNFPTVNEKFELFFKYEMAFQYYNNSWDGTYYNPESAAYEVYSDNSSEFFYGNSIAYGFTYRPNSQIFLRLDAGGGLYMSSIKGDYEDYYGQANARYDFRGYGNVGGFVKFAFAAGYNF